MYKIQALTLFFSTITEAGIAPPLNLPGNAIVQVQVHGGQVIYNSEYYQKQRMHMAFCAFGCCFLFFGILTTTMLVIGNNKHGQADSLDPIRDFDALRMGCYVVDDNHIASTETRTVTESYSCGHHSTCTRSYTVTECIDRYSFEVRLPDGTVGGAEKESYIRFDGRCEWEPFSAPVQPGFLKGNTYNCWRPALIQDDAVNNTSGDTIFASGQRHTWHTLSENYRCHTPECFRLVDPQEDVIHLRSQGEGLIIAGIVFGGKLVFRLSSECINIFF